MLRYAAYRLALLVPLVFGLSVALFFYLQLIPGDPVAAMLGPSATPALVASMRHQFGLDQPLLTQYTNWLGGLVRGDLGVSLVSQQHITPLLINRIPATLQLTLSGMFFTVLLGLPMGFLAGLRKGSWIDRLLSSVVLVGLSAPIFWVGTLLILLFAVRLHWLPSLGYVPLFQNPAASLGDTLMPALTLGISMAPYLARMTRAATIEVLQEPFVTFAEAKGLKRATIIGRYVGRNAIGQIVIVLGLEAGALLSGQVLVENLFAWPGMGRLLIDGVTQRDYYVVEAVILVFAILFVLMNLAAELVQAWLDPRIRL